MINKLKYIFAAITFLFISSYSLPINSNHDYDSQHKEDTIHYIEKHHQYPDTNKKHLGTYKITAYDLSYQSCQKLPDHPAYGITASGISLKNHSRESAMAIAVDPNHIPLGSDVLLIFNGSRSKYSGIYKAVDTGGAIKGNKIDLFVGDTQNAVSQEAIDFGVTSAEVYIINYV